MNRIATSLNSMKMQTVHFLGLPVFFLLFVLVYNPFDFLGFLQTRAFGVGVNLVMLLCIMVAVLAGTRVTLHFIRIKFTFVSYILWCVAELCLLSLFCALYLCLMRSGEPGYFTTLGICAKCLAGALVYPYVIFALYAYAISGSSANAPGEDAMMRFRDYSHKVKFTIAQSAVLYIKAEENYVRIFYSDGGRICNYVLRASMKSIEEMVTGHGLKRCHRSYFVNPQHISLLRKDRDLGALADFDIPGAESIPVSKSYYGAISEIL